MKSRLVGWVFVFLLTFKCVFFSVVIYAQKPEGEEKSSEKLEARALKISQEISARQAAIENIQSDLGVFDQSLIEVYGETARFYAELQDYESAIGLYTEALQIARINTGLYSHEQLPILDSLIDNNSRFNQWREVDNLQELNYLINSRLYDDTNLEYLEAVDRYGTWKLRLVRENLLDQSRFTLLNTAEELSRFYNRTIERLEFAPEIHRVDLLPIIYSKSQVDLTLARSVAATPYTAFQGTERQYVNQTRCRNIRNSQGQVQRQCSTVQVENPRYRASQREAKQFALQRHTRNVSRSITMLEGIRNSSTELSNSAKQQIEVQIGELVMESEQLVRSSRKLL